MGQCCCCSKLAAGPPEFNNILKKADDDENRESTPPPRQMQQKQLEVEPTKQLEAEPTKRLEVAPPEKSTSTLPVPRSSQLSVGTNPSEVNIERSSSALSGPLSFKLSTKLPEVDLGLPQQLSSVIIHPYEESGSRFSEDESRGNSSNFEKDTVSSPVIQTQKTLHLIRKLSKNYNEDEQYSDENDETALVSRQYLNRALSEDWEEKETRHSRSNSIGVNSWDVSWLRNDYEPDFIETLQLAEEKMFIDERPERTRLNMHVIKEESSQRTDSSEITISGTHTPQMKNLNNENKQKDSEPLQIDVNIPKTIVEEEEINPEKDALLNDVLSRSQNPKIRNKEMRALKRKLVDAYIDAIPSSRRHLTMISFAVDQIWKDVTDRSKGNLTLLGNQYTKELRWLRSKKDENTKKEISQLTNVRSKLHTRVGVGYSPSYDDDPNHTRYKTPNMTLIVDNSEPSIKD